MIIKRFSFFGGIVYTKKSPSIIALAAVRHHTLNDVELSTFVVQMQNEDDVDPVLGVATTM